MKKALLTLIITILSGLIFIAVLVIVADPFFHYHEPLGYDGAYLYNEVYQLPGEAASFQYDTVLIGSSMIENYHVNWFEEYGEKAVKLCYSGAKLANLYKLFDVIFASDNEIKHIYLDINDYQLTAEPGSVFGDVPEYLYDKNPLNDVQYIYNKDVVLASIAAIKSYIKRDGNVDEAFTWEDESLFGKDKVMEDYGAGHKDQAWINTEDDATDINVKANLNQLVKLINDHPEVSFTIVYPPYSIAYWMEKINEGVLEQKLYMYLESMSILAECENVTQYFFMDNSDVISDLDNYRDICHYRPAINKYMVECMHLPENAVKKDDVTSRIDTLRECIEKYRFE